MPDAKLADGHLAVAKRLAATKRPTQSEIRRSISSSYYAMFHALARTCANALVGKTPSRRPNKAWVEVYRGLSHGICQRACKRASQVDFPGSVKNFADAFQQLQEQRHRADYDPNTRFTKFDGETWCELARLSIASLRSASDVDKRAFATWVLISSRGAENARRTNVAE